MSPSKALTHHHVTTSPQETGFSNETSVSDLGRPSGAGGNRTRDPLDAKR
jgi:hypothetical protein